MYNVCIIIVTLYYTCLIYCVNTWGITLNSQHSSIYHGTEYNSSKNFRQTLGIWPCCYLKAFLYVYKTRKKRKEDEILRSTLTILLSAAVNYIPGIITPFVAFTIFIKDCELKSVFEKRSALLCDLRKHCALCQVIFSKIFFCSGFVRYEWMAADKRLILFKAHGCQGT